MSDKPDVLVRELTDSYILITGGTSGIGLQDAREFAKNGAPKIAINGRHEGRGKAAIEALEKEFPGQLFLFISQM